MIKIIIEQKPENYGLEDDIAYTCDATISLSEEATGYQAIEAFVKALQFEGYLDCTIANALYDRALDFTVDEGIIIEGRQNECN